MGEGGAVAGTTRSRELEPGAAFARLRDRSEMRAVFRERLSRVSGGSLDVTACEILHARLRPKFLHGSWRQSTLTVCYRLAIGGGSTDGPASQLFFAKGYLGGRSRSAYRRLDRHQWVRPRYGESVAHLPELDAIVWGFPNDPKLPQLPEVVDARKVLRHLPWDRLGEIAATPVDADVSSEIARYFPESRCTIRYRVTGRGERACTVYGKTFRADGARVVHDRIEHLWRAFLPVSRRIGIAKPLGFDEATNTVWQEGVTGAPLAAVLDDENAERLLGRVAAGLATVHGSGLVCPVVLTAEAQLASLRRKFDRIGRCAPELGRRVMPLLARAETGFRDVGTTTMLPIHGGFEAGQLLLQGGRLMFFDFDDLALGDPAQDIAQFIVDLHYHGFDKALVRRMSGALVDAYRCCAPLSEASLRWHVLMRFANKAYAFCRRGGPARDQRIDEILAELGA